MLKLQKFLKTHSIDELIDKYSIIVRIHNKYPNLFQFKYNQIDSPLSKKIVQECRGIILDRQQDWKVVCMTYTKFFNYGESQAANINWKHAKITEKKDGSLMQMFYYRNKWHVATSGMPDASGQVELTNTSFKTLFWNVWEELNYTLPLDTNLCYAFELTTPYNKVIVQHKTNNIVLHAARDIDTLKELDYKTIAIKNNWKYVKQYKFNSIKEVIKASKEINPIEEEGYVVVDNKFHRVKVKSPQYVALHHIKDGCSIRKILEIVITNEEDEFLTYFPEYTKIYNIAKYKLKELVKDTEFIYNKIKDITNQKEFALKAVKSPCSFVLFQMRNKRIDTIKEGIYNIRSKILVQMLGLKNEKII